MANTKPAPGRDARDIFYIGIGDAIGGAIILDGKLWTGASGCAGEIGHITIDTEGAECVCGNTGCLETIASGPNIVRRARERLNRDSTSSLSRLAMQESFTAADLALEANNGDDFSVMMLERTGRSIGIAVASMINLLSIERIILGGAVMEAGDLILKPIIAEARKRSFQQCFEATKSSPPNSARTASPLARRCSPATLSKFKHRSIKISIMKRNSFCSPPITCLHCRRLAQTKVDDQSPKCTLGLDHVARIARLSIWARRRPAVLARFPGISVEKPDKFGLARLRLTVIDSVGLIKGPTTRDKGVQSDITARPADGSAFVLDSTKFPSLKGVRRIEFRFIDGRLSFVAVAYDDAIKWDNIDDFVSTVSKTLNLPKDWQTPADAGGDSTEKELRCDAFVISANVGTDATGSRMWRLELTLEDLAAWKAISKRQNDLTEKAKREADEKRKGFKP